MTIDLYIRQLEEVLAALGVAATRPIELVGWSLGGAIASNFAQRHPACVRKLVLLAPAGCNVSVQREDVIGALLGGGVKAAINRALFALVVRSTCKKRYAHELRAMSDGGKWLSFLCQHVDENAGLARAIVSTLLDCRQVFQNGEVLRELGASSLPMLLLFAKDDGAVGPPPCLAELRVCLPHAHVHVLDEPGLDHAMHLTHRALVQPLLVDFLCGPEAGRAV
jgi:pimeloyl-ACP methyl ester carboxylesterase